MGTRHVWTALSSIRSPFLEVTQICLQKTVLFHSQQISLNGTKLPPTQQAGLENLSSHHIHVLAPQDRFYRLVCCELQVTGYLTKGSREAGGNLPLPHLKRFLEKGSSRVFFRGPTKLVSGSASLRFSWSQGGCRSSKYCFLILTISKKGQREQRYVPTFLFIIKEEHFFQRPPVDFSEGSIDHSCPCPIPVTGKRSSFIMIDLV